MNNTGKQRRSLRPKQIAEKNMNYQIEKPTASTCLKAPLQAGQGTPMYSSPWLALYFHLKANLNQSSVS
jgi:hypothetical protein